MPSACLPYSDHRRTLRWPAAILGAALLAACAGPEARLRSGLEQAGVPPAMAACMAERMNARLSLAQLNRIRALADSHRSGDRQAFLAEVRRFDDPEIVRVTTTAAAACAIGL